jgi:hypothetical protein
MFHGIKMKLGETGKERERQVEVIIGKGKATKEKA